jgi:hypothetical protein
MSNSSTAIVAAAAALASHYRKATAEDRKLAVAWLAGNPAIVRAIMEHDLAQSARLGARVLSDAAREVYPETVSIPEVLNTFRLVAILLDALSSDDREAVRQALAADRVLVAGMGLITAIAPLKASQKVLQLHGELMDQRETVRTTMQPKRGAGRRKAMIRMCLAVDAKRNATPPEPWDAIARWVCREHPKWLKDGDIEGAAPTVREREKIGRRVKATYGRWIESGRPRR